MRKVAAGGRQRLRGQNIGPLLEHSLAGLGAREAFRPGRQGQTGPAGQLSRQFFALGQSIQGQPPSLNFPVLPSPGRPSRLLASLPDPVCDKGMDRLRRICLAALFADACQARPADGFAQKPQ
jgi:hypothetical protein